MIYHIKESETKSSVSFPHLCTVLIFMFMVIFLYPLLPGGSEVNAQDNGDAAKADFLFQKPKNFFGLRFGRFFPDADSNIFNSVTTQLTLEKNDFQAWNFGIDLGVNVHDRIDLVFSLDYSNRTIDSEMRDYPGYVDDVTGYPVTQSTKFSQTPLTAGMKFLIIPRGRQVGRYSWLPSRFVPYLSGGLGFLRYEFSQNGDIIIPDPVTDDLEIWRVSLYSDGTTFTIYHGCGLEINIFKSTYINLDFRYYWAEDDLEGGFKGFDPIDLSGFRLTTGIQWHF